MRYTLRRQDNGLWSVWDSETDAPAEAYGICYINLAYEEAVEERDNLNPPELSQLEHSRRGG